MKTLSTTLLISGLITGLILSGTVSAKQVGQIKYARGAITVQNEDGSDARLIGKGGAVNEGQILKTGPKSFAIISMDDDTKMTIRPRTSFAVEKYNAQRSNKASALLRLFRGGLRAVTGYISKFNNNGYKIKTSVATIGIRGTKFDARICEKDCNEENQKIEKKSKDESVKAVAKVVFKRGEIQAENFKDDLRNLKTRSSVFEGDTIMTGEDSYAVMVFRDKSRVSLQELTNFRIDELRYKGKKAAKGASALFSLLRGGLRTVTGLIGRLNPKSYRMRTSVATIGIRGTGYDLMCTGACAVDGSRSKTPLPRGDGLYSSVWDGSIAMGELPVGTNQAGFQRTTTAKPVRLPVVPAFFKNNPVPKPNTIKVDEDTLFTASATQDVPPGLYVSVKEGKVTVNNDTTNEFVQITKGQAAYAGAQGRVAQLPRIPAFQAQDIFPTPDNFSARAVNIGGTAIGDKDASAICEVK